MLTTPLAFFKMLLLSFIILTASTFLAQIPIINSLTISNEGRATGSLNDFIASEGPIALQGVLNNIGAAGSKAAGTALGLVVASPSKSNPDCEWLV